MGGTRKIFVCSGKGGVGKTTVAVSLAVALARKGYDVGILDGDLTGANVTDCLGAGELEVRADRFVPARSMGVKYASLAQIASEGDPVLWSVLAELPFRPEVARRKVIDGLDVEPFLKAMEHPVLLEKRVSARAKILKALLLASEAGKDG